jgi:type IV pilus assembly protein PilQ
MTALAAAAALVILAAGPLAAQTFAPAPDRPAAPAAAPAGSVQTPAGQSAGGASTSLDDPCPGLLANRAYTGERISLDFQNADIHNILRIIARVSGKNVVISDAVTGRVTLKLQNVPWDQALDIVLANKSLCAIENGNVIRIDTVEAIRRAIPDYTNPANQDELPRKMFTPKYASVSTLATEMAKASSSYGTVKVIGTDIYVRDDERALQRITEIFNRNDRVSKQILIESRIVEATANFSQNLGVRWTVGYDHVSGGGNNWEGKDNEIFPSRYAGTYSPGELYGVATVAERGVAQIGFGFLNRAGSLALSAELNASESVGESRTISAPRIMAANDETVYIKQGAKIPYPNRSDEGAGTEFQEAVLELNVMPHIEENGEIVTLDINIKKDSPGAAGADGMRELNTKEAKTKLMVRNGETVVIGGIVSDTQSNDNYQVPGLHSIPLLGWLFKEREQVSNKEELLIFITANIIPMTL